METFPLLTRTALVITLGGLLVASPPAASTAATATQAHQTVRTAVATTAATTTSARSVPRAVANPLAGGPWGVYTRSDDEDIGAAWHRAHGTDKLLLQKIAGQPRARWFTSGLKVRLFRRIHRYILHEQNGNPNTLVQMAIFRIFPRGEDKRNRRLTNAERAGYKRWINTVAEAIGSARVALILEPDLAEVAPPGHKHALRTADPGVRLALVRWAARRFSGLPRTSVYIDAGDADWLSQRKAVSLLLRAGVGYARGFALGASHYGTVESNIAYASRISRALAAKGHPGKKAVLDTSDNARGFTHGYWAHHKKMMGSDPRTCKRYAERKCVTLGLPPTWQVTRFGLPAGLAKEAASYVDAYLWFGRPWRVDQASPFSLKRALSEARSTPYSQTNITRG